MKKMRNSVKCLIAFFAMATAFCATSVTANAAVTVQQAGASESYVKIQWSQVVDASTKKIVPYYGYEVATDAAFTNIVKESYKSSNATTTYLDELITGLLPGTSYYVRVGYGMDRKDCKRDMSAPLEVVTSPTKVTAVKFIGADDTTSTIAYDAPGATGYVIEYNGALIADVNTTTFTFPVVDGANNVKVYPYRASASGFKALGYVNSCSDICKLTTTFPKESFGIETAHSNINVFYIAAIGYGKGFDLEAVPVSGKGNKVAATTTIYNMKGSIRVDNFTKGVMYKYRVRAYVTTTDGQKIYGNWSTYRYLINTRDSKYIVGHKNIKLKWGKLKGVTKIKIQIATSENGKYKTCKVLSSKKKNYTVTKCGKAPLKKGKQYWVKVIYMTKGGQSDICGMASKVKMK